MLVHAGTGASVPVPEGWEVVAGDTGVAADAVAAALEPAAGPAGFRANLVLSVVHTGLDFRQWQVNTDILLPQALTDLVLLDLERLEVAGRPGGRRLARHVGAGGTDLTLEQWFVLVDGAGVTVSATVDSWRYDALAAELAEHALRLSVPERVAL